MGDKIILAIAILLTVVIALATFLAPQWVDVSEEREVVNNEVSIPSDATDVNVQPIDVVYTAILDEANGKYCLLYETDNDRHIRTINKQEFAAVAATTQGVIVNYTVPMTYNDKLANSLPLGLALIMGTWIIYVTYIIVRIKIEEG